MDNRNNIDDFFKERLRNYTQTPSSGVWEKVMSESVPLRNITEKPVIRNRAFAALAIATMAVVLVVVFYPSGYNAEIYSGLSFDKPDFAQKYSNQTFEYSRSDYSEATMANTEKTVLIANNLTSDLPLKKINNQIQLSSPLVFAKEENNELILTENSNTLNTNSDSTIPQINYDLTTISENQIEEEDKKQISQEFAIEMDFAPELDLIQDELSSSIKGFYLGVAGGYNYTTILENQPVSWNNKTLQASSKFGQVKGFTLGYNFSPSFGIQLDYNYNSVEGKNYVIDNASGKEKSLVLYYNQIPVTFKYKISQLNYLTQKPVVVNLYAGVQLNKLTNYRIPQEKRYEESEEMFNESTVSLVMGIDYDIYLTRALLISLGARSTLSNDIAEQSYPFQDNSTNSFTIGLRGGLYYRLPSN